MKKDILSLADFELSDFTMLFDRAAELKARHKRGIPDRTLTGKSIGLIFDKPSTRTRISFESAAIQLGATPIFIHSGDTQMARNEPIEDTARVLSRYLDGVAYRTYSQELIEKFASVSDIPVINALTDKFHPCQVLSDLLTVIEHKGSIEGLTVAWIGDGNNMAHSWINAAAILGFSLNLACPKAYYPDKDIMTRARKKNKRIFLTTSPMDAAQGADVINTDVWASMGQEHEQKERQAVFAPYQVNSLLLDVAARDAIVMHCLPAHRGEEITADVLDGPQSVVWDQAENKLHMHKAILDVLLTS
ncbi:MAG: ornithine carbamoyltransferase [Desulfobacteraceae bacterium]|nr:MAG: ornithine carbamoyltransferase [Desulfobacteraceae bacterium]